MMTASSALADAAITFVCCAYNPSSVTISAGESVSWSGNFAFPHPLRQVDGPNSDTPVPGGFANSTGTFYSVQFNTPGTYYYQCAVHGLAQFGGTMRGQITVLGSGSLTLQSVVSRKTHGSVNPQVFDLALGAVASNPTTEPRAGGAGGTHSLVFIFDQPVAGGNAAVTEGTAIAAPPTFNGAEMSVALSGVPNATYATVSVSNVAPSGGGSPFSGSVRVGFLAGDVNGSRAVTLSDVLSVNAVLAQPLNAATFLRDVNTSGTLSLSDKLFVNSNLAQVLPAP